MITGTPKGDVQHKTGNIRTINKNFVIYGFSVLSQLEESFLNLWKR